jgi:hypothetical protein
MCSVYHAVVYTLKCHRMSLIFIWYIIIIKTSYVQILLVLNLSNKTSKLHIVAMFVIVRSKNMKRGCL